MKRFLPKIKELETVLIISEYLNEDLTPYLSLDDEFSSKIEINFIELAISSDSDPVDMAFYLTRDFISKIIYLETQLYLIEEKPELLNTGAGLIIYQENIDKVADDFSLFREYLSESLNSLLDSFPEYYGSHGYKPLLLETMEELRRKKNILDSSRDFKCFMCGKTIWGNETTSKQIAIVIKVEDGDPYASQVFICSSSCLNIYSQGK